MQMSTSSSYVFGPYKIDPREVFYSTPFSYAMVNLRPLLPGISHSSPIIHSISLLLLLYSYIVFPPFLAGHILFFSFSLFWFLL